MCLPINWHTSICCFIPDSPKLLLASEIPRSRPSSIKPTKWYRVNVQLIEPLLVCSFRAYLRCDERIGAQHIPAESLSSKGSDETDWLVAKIQKGVRDIGRNLHHIWAGYREPLVAEHIGHHPRQ